MIQASKFGSYGDEDEEELDEESLLETPLDKVEPYSLFKNVLLGMYNLLYTYVTRNPC